MRKLLVVEDEEMLGMLLSDRLVSEGYKVDVQRDGDNGLRAALEGSYDLVILDVMLPGRDGLAVCEQIRRQGMTIPILMLTARGDVRDRITGLRTGADDYLPKPFDVVELLARVEALLRRSKPVGGDQIAFGPVSVDRVRKVVSRDRKAVDLSFKEFQMLCYLLDRPGRPVSREELLQKVWGYEHTPTTRTVDVHMAQLRGKLEHNPREPKYLVTVHGFGYKYDNGDQ